jgi:uncharacterized membrane protein
MAAFCSSCGAQLPDGTSFCQSCGKPTGVSAGAGGAAVAPAVTPVAASDTGIQDNIGGLLCYLPFVGLVADIVFLLAEPYKSKPFLKFHAIQSLLLGAACFVFFFVWGLISIPLSFIGGLGLLAITPIIDLAVLALWVWMIISAYQMKTVRLPIIGQIAARSAGLQN